jgi:hypothetical protein
MTRELASAPSPSQLVADPPPDCAPAAGTFLISAKEPITKARGAVADISAAQGRRHKRNLNCRAGWTGHLNVACSNYHRREIKMRS